MKKIAGFLWTACFGLSMICRAQIPADPVLIVYSSGEPFKTIGEMSAGEADAVASATPKSWNCRIAAERIGEAFRGTGRLVRVAPVDSILNYREILRYRVVIFGMPARFWNVGWEMKRFIDAHIGKIYIAAQPEFRKCVIGGFAMAEIPASAEAALETFGRALSDCGTKFRATAVFLTGDNPESEEVRAKIIQLMASLTIAECPVSAQ
jgi:hypothetical protein